MNSTRFSLAFLSLTFASGIAYASPALPTAPNAAISAPVEILVAQVAVQPVAEGEVRRVDKSNSKITLRHGPIVNLDMPAMTMVFQVRDAKLLETIKVGDKVRFSAESVKGTYFVTDIVHAESVTK